MMMFRLLRAMVMLLMRRAFVSMFARPATYFGRRLMDWLAMCCALAMTTWLRPERVMLRGLGV